MTYKIIRDSCLNLIEDMKKDPRFQIIPLTLQVGSAQIVDDETFSQKWFTETVKACSEYPKTACPSPGTFRTAFAKADTEVVFIIASSGHLSGNYSSAVMVKKLYEEEMTEGETAEQAKKMAVIDSFSVPSEELNVTLLIQNLCDSGLEFDEVVEETLAYRDGVNTCFVLGSLDTLRKSGRLPGLQIFFTTAFGIKPVTSADAGTIIKLDQAGGMDKALHRMCDIAVEEVVDAAGKIAVACHVNGPERTGYVRDELAKRVGLKKTVVANTAGVATVYANDGGTVLAI